MGQCSTTLPAEERLKEDNPKSLDFRKLEEIRNTPSIPSLRTRCYKLNLNSKSNTLGGPYTTEQSMYDQVLTTSSTTESNESLAVAIQTATIFRGLKVSDDGTILSQNARATRSNRNKNLKKTEKSRQATKIEKAISKPSTNLVSLVPVGEYDDMKLLVRDGSRKLREAEGLPDAALLRLNRNRYSTNYPSPVKHSSSSSKPPKLKSHPRDRVHHHQPHQPRTQNTDPDWFLWNCGMEGRQGLSQGREAGIVRRAG